MSVRWATDIARSRRKRHRDTTTRTIEEDSPAIPAVRWCERARGGDAAANLQSSAHPPKRGGRRRDTYSGSAVLAEGRKQSRPSGQRARAPSQRIAGTRTSANGL